MKAIYSGKDQSWANGTTTYWFDVGGEMYGVVEGGESSDSSVVDFEGYPSDQFTADDFEITDAMRAE